MKSTFRIYKNIFADFSLLITAAVCIVSGNENMYIIAFSAIIHELAHYAAACLCGFKPENFVIKGFGIELVGGKYFSPGVLAIVAACGPAANLILAYIALKLNIFSFFVVNISVAVINLIPALPLDGGHILYASVCNLINRKTAKKVTRISGKVSGVLITILGVMVLCVSKMNFSLLYIGLFVFFSNSSSCCNPVIETMCAKERDIEKCPAYAIKDSMRALDAANAMPHNALGVVKDETGECYGVVSPCYLYNKLAESGSASTVKSIMKQK